jgi:hypothetical protein
MLWSPHSLPHIHMLWSQGTGLVSVAHHWCDTRTYVGPIGSWRARQGARAAARCQGRCNRACVRRTCMAGRVSSQPQGTEMAPKRGGDRRHQHQPNHQHGDGALVSPGQGKPRARAVRCRIIASRGEHTTAAACDAVPTASGVKMPKRVHNKAAPARRVVSR